MLRLQFCAKIFFLYLRTVKPIYLFNPEHDLALANGDRHFIAPRNIREMASDLAALMSIAAPLYERVSPPCSTVPHPIPWGWDAASAERFKKMGIPAEALPTAEALATLSQHSERGLAHHLLKAFRHTHPDNVYIGESLIVHSTDELAAYAMQHGHILLKAPLSGSGKGLRHVNFNDNDSVDENSTSALKKVESWANALIRRHGYLTAEPYYTKVQDFAMEFIADATGCHFIGYSLFVTDSHGRYIGSRLTSDAEIENTLASYVQREALHEVRRWVIAHHSRIIPTAWDTAQHPLPFGIDMMVVRTLDNSQPTTTDERSKSRSKVYFDYALQGGRKLLLNREQSSCLLELPRYEAGKACEAGLIQTPQFKFHPCVEINLRMNMGIIAHELYRHRLTPDATGTYQIARFADNATLRQFHEEHTQLHPATYHDGKLSSGYMLLTPITDDTLHLAYVLCD